MTGIPTNRELTVRFQGGAWVGSGLREGNGPFQGSPECVVFPALSLEPWKMETVCFFEM
jgi:hypothetical protein